MKIRIKGNSIRYRLSQLDLSLLKDTSNIVSNTHIGTDVLHFCVRATEFTNPDIQIEHNNIHLLIPHGRLDEWYASDEAGFELRITNPDGSEIQLLIEKDFQCLTPRDEDDSQAFENPNAGKNC